MTDLINKHKKKLTWALCAVAAVAVLLFLGDQLAGKKAARIVQHLDFRRTRRWRLRIGGAGHCGDQQSVPVSSTSRMAG